MNEKRLPKNPDTDKTMFNNEFSVASATECTGLVPSAPEDRADVASYADIYDVALTANDALHRPRNHAAIDSRKTTKRNREIVD